MNSILVLTCNHESYIGDCLRGVFNQLLDWSDTEIIILDDCSSDKTQERINDVVSTVTDKDIRLIYHDINYGPRESSLHLLSEARGEFVAVIEGDDFWTDNTKLARQYESLKSSKDVALVFTDIVLLNSDGSDIADDHPKKIEYIRMSANRKRAYSILDIFYSNTINSCTVCFKREYLDLEYLRRYNYCLYDALLWMSICRNGFAVYDRSKTTSYRVHGQGLSGSEEIRDSWRRIRYAAIEGLIAPHMFINNKDKWKYVKFIIWMIRSGGCDIKKQIVLLCRMIAILFSFVVSKKLGPL